MQQPKLGELRLQPARRRPGLALVPPAPAPAGPRLAAAARVRHALLRTMQEFLDRAGCVELASAPDDALAADLGRTSWPASAGVVAGHLAGADDAALIDLLERGRLAALHGTLSRAYGDLQALEVDLDMLKYLRLPVRRVPTPGAAARGPAGETLVRRPAPWSGPSDRGVMAEAGEPVLLVAYAPDQRDSDPDAAAPELQRARLLLPDVGCVATAARGGRFSFDLAALATFLTTPRVAVLARPARD